MPFRAAHWYLLALFGLTIIAFWPTYFAVLGKAPATLHVHGVTAMAWVLLLVVQSWAIHARRNALHRTLGLASMALFALFASSGLLVIQTMARAALANADPFYEMFGAPLALYDALATVGALYFYHEALRRRRTIPLHAGYMIGTVLFLLGPIVVRLFGIYVPWLMIRRLEDFYLFDVQLHLSTAVGIAICACLARLKPRHATPFFLAGGIMLAQSLTFKTLGPSAAWRAALEFVVATPSALLFALGLLVVVPVITSGWLLGTTPRRAPVPA